MMRFILLVFLALSMLDARSSKHYDALIAQAERHAAPHARTVLAVARRMVTQEVIVRGSCWDYLNAVFLRAGFPAAQRRIVYASDRTGPYAEPARLQPGDWLYYVNHSYGDIEHSGLFVGWVHRARMQGLILSYGGEHRNKPGRYRVYDLQSVYRIMRVP